MAEENTDIPVALEINEAEDSSKEECFDIPVVAVEDINEPEDVSEEIIDIPLIVKVNEPECSNVIVIGDFSITKSRPKILSRYLLPSPGSCHDFCKYGMNKPFEGKPGIPLLRKVKSDGGRGRDLKRTTIPLAKQIKHAISLKSSPCYKTQFSINNNNDLKEDVMSLPNVVTQSPKRLLSSIKEVEAAVVNCSGKKLNPSQSKRSSFEGQGCLRTKGNKEFGKGKEQYGGASCSTNSTSRCQMNTSTEEDRKAFVQPDFSWTPKYRVKRVVKADKNSIGRFRMRNQSLPIKIKTIQSYSVDVPEKTLYIIEPTNENATDELTRNSVHTTDLSEPQSSSATDSSLKHDHEVDHTPQVPQLSAKENVRCARIGIGSRMLSPSSSVSWGFKGLRHKKFGTAGTQSFPSSPSLSPSPSEPIHNKHGNPSSGNDVKKSEYSKMQHKSKPQRMGIIDSENGDCQLRRVKFRKGRVVDLQPENNAPRRLKFRRVRLLGETKNSNSDSRKRSIQNKEANHNGEEAKETENNALRRQDQVFKRKKFYRRKEIIDGKSAAYRIKSEKVVLRRQESKGKKEIQSLFNNVIEETANKLEQTRKSKVKALVGAFETVISLQDTRPSATIDS